MIRAESGLKSSMETWVAAHWPAVGQSIVRTPPADSTSTLYGNATGVAKFTVSAWAQPMRVQR
jgi:hypothetical protein